MPPSVLEYANTKEAIRGNFFLKTPPVFQDGQIVRGGMWPSQRAWWDLPNFVRLLVGGYGSGKSLQLCKRHMALAMVNAPVPTGLVSPTYGMAKETLIPTLEDLLSAQETARKSLGQRFSWSQKKTAPYKFYMEMTVPVRGGHYTRRKGTITIYSGEDPKKLKGTNLSSAGIDEPFIQDLEVFTQMHARCRHPQSKVIEMNLAGTPEQLNWGYDLAEGDMRDDFDVGVVTMSTLENKALGTGYVDRLLRSFDEKTAQAYVHGLFVNLTKGLVYHAFDRRENVVPLERPSGSGIGVGMDFNVNPMAATVFWYTTGSRGEHMHFFDEIELANSDTEEMCAVLKERYWEQGLRDIYPDSNAGRATNTPGGKTDYDIIEDAGFVVNRLNQNPGVRDRHNCVNGMFKPTGGRIRMTIDPQCKKLIKYNSVYSHELRKKQKDMSHLLDARDYAAWYLFPSSKEDLKVPLRGV